MYAYQRPYIDCKLNVMRACVRRSGLRDKCSGGLSAAAAAAYHAHVHFLSISRLPGVSAYIHI